MDGGDHSDRADSIRGGGEIGPAAIGRAGFEGEEWMDGEEMWAVSKCDRAGRGGDADGRIQKDRALAGEVGVGGDVGDWKVERVSVGARGALGKRNNGADDCADCERDDESAT